MPKLTNEFIEELNKNKTWLMSSGILLCFIGLMLIFISSDDFRIRAINLFIVCNLFFASIILAIHAFRFWFNKSAGLIIYMIESLAYLLMAFFFFTQHSVLLVYVPLLLIVVFFIFGLFEIYQGFLQVYIYKGWMGTILAGIVSLGFSILGMYLFYSIQISEIILALGLNSLFVGISFIALRFRNVT